MRKKRNASAKSLYLYIYENTACPVSPTYNGFCDVFIHWLNLELPRNGHLRAEVMRPIRFGNLGARPWNSFSYREVFCVQFAASEYGVESLPSGNDVFHDMEHVASPNVWQSSNTLESQEGHHTINLQKSANKHG